MKRYICLIAGVLVCCLSACNQNQDFSKKAQHLKISFNSDPGSLDPRRGGDASKAIIEFMLFEGLTRFSNEGQIELAGAEKIEISQDQTTYTFTLKNNVWSDGTAITAFEYEKAWKDSLNPSFPSSFAHLLYAIKNAEKAKRGLSSVESIGVKAIDARTLVVQLEHPTPYFLELTAFYTFFPVKQGKNENDFLSNGPFKLACWNPNSEITLERNPNYWGKKDLKLDRITINIIDNEMTTLQMYEMGALDLAGAPLSPLPLEALPILYKEGKLHTQPVAGSTLCVFNTETLPFSNLHMRKAFALAIDRQAIVESITQLGEEVTTGVIPPLLKNKALVNFLDTNSISAREHFTLGLQELGLDRLPVITYVYPHGELDSKMAELLQQTWEKVLGVHVELKKMEKKVLLNYLDSKNFQLGQASWLAFYNDPMDILERFRIKTNPKNFSGWENNSYTQLLERSLTESPENRLSTFEQAEHILIEEMPLTVLYHWKYGYLQNPKLKGVFISPIGDIYFTHAYFEK